MWCKICLIHERRSLKGNQRAGKWKMKSAVPGVSITQFVDRIPAGCSTPDFERKPVTLSLQEGKNAIFRAVVKGAPTPEVKWKRAKGEMNDPTRYQTYFNPATNEFILQINKLTADDTDLYRCFAVNEYGEAVCSAGLRIIQGRIRRFCSPKLKKKLKDYKKMLRKRAPQPQAKQVDKEAVWQLLLHADKKDYERICIKYGISDFRGMLKKLQEIRRTTELAHGENLQHIMVTKDGKAVLSLEMELKNSNSKIYLLKDGEKLRYGTGDEYRKHCLKQVGKKYTFIVNDVHPEDAGLYQVKVEDVPVFSTELDAEAIPVRFQQPLRDTRCHEGEDVVFGCTLRTPCYDAVWLHKTHLLEESGKHQISVSPDGLTHQLIIKNADPSDNGMYTLDTGICSSNAWLIVEFEKSSKAVSLCQLARSILVQSPVMTAVYFFKIRFLLTCMCIFVCMLLSVSLCSLYTSFSELPALRCRVDKPLVDVRVVKGKSAELACTVSSKDVQGTWFKDGLKVGVAQLLFSLINSDQISNPRILLLLNYLDHNPPQVDQVLLKNLTNVPTVTKAGQKVKIKIPFEGQLPIRATWLKDGMELIDDTRIRVDKADTFTMLSISSSERKDCGDYKIRLKNDHGVLEINLKLVVIDKPEQPTGPIKVIESSSSDITIQWKPPKDDGGKPVQNYIIQMQQVGKEEWVTLGETPKTCTTFTTNKVEQDMGYYFRLRAVNVEGASEPLESDEVKAASKAIPGPPDPPEIVSTGKETITISWKAPHNTGSSRIVGYLVQKRKKGASTWVPVTNMPVADRKLKMTNLKMGLQYEFRVAAVNAAGVGEASAASQPAFARDSTEPPGQVRDLRVASHDSTSITLTWKAPETKDGIDVKGYEVEMRSYVNPNWTKCSVLPIKATTYTVKGLQAKELYFLRVRAINDSGPGEAAELETFVEAPPPVVPPRFLINDRVKSFLVIKAGNTIRVPMRFEASPDPVVTWLKDGHPLPQRAKINTEHGTTQLLIEAAEFSDTGTYTVELQNGSGNKESFNIPQSPGPVVLEENVPKTVTVTWEPSPSEKWESDLYYTVLKRESQKGSWHTVGDMIYTNKFTYTKLIPGRDYYFRVVAKNCLGTSGPSENVDPWRLKKQKADFQIRQREYRGVNQNQPPRFLVQLKPHTVTIGTECQMSCAVTGHPQPKITWYKDGRDLSKDPTYLCKNIFGVCSLMILGVIKNDEGEYMVEASNALGRAFSKASLTITGNNL
uniref:Immunoglobulin like and fibronectin type III domain containing 1 n=1 Tax=Nothoprocta perdicaria TaxID=30464 RepID=A0A8C6YMV6_NOTPE